MSNLDFLFRCMIVTMSITIILVVAGNVARAVMNDTEDGE